MKCFYTSGLGTATVQCTNEASTGGMYCEHHHVSPEAESRIAERFGQARRCAKCDETFRTKDPKQRRCAGCRTFG